MGLLIGGLFGLLVGGLFSLLVGGFFYVFVDFGGVVDGNYIGCF